jgi:predicted Fe-Mo cluster-binding NifX family protein
MDRRIAIPVESGMLCEHFGHCEYFYIADVKDKEIVKEEMITPPEHQPGLYPAWVAEKGVSIVIAGGMGEKAKQLFGQQNIELLVGAVKKEPKELVLDFINDKLITGANTCNHHEHEHSCK